MKEKIAKLQKIKLNRSLKIRIAITLLILVVFLFVVISYMKTYSDYIVKPDSVIDGGVVYVNDYASDYYYYKGMKYVGDLNNNTVNYTDANLVPVTLNYHGHASGISACDNNDYTNCGYVSLSEPQYKYVYYKYYPLESGYINIELIENPFSSRPINKAFGGWTTSTGTLSKNSNTKVQSLRVAVTTTNGVPNSIEINLYASWIDANVIWLDGEEGDDNFDGSFEDPVGSWGKAFQLLEANATNSSDREQNIIVLKGNISNSINYTQSLTHNWATTINYTDNTTFTSGETYILEYVAGNNRYALTDNGTNLGYATLSTTVEPEDNTKWIITSKDNGYTIQNTVTNRYLSYEVDGLNVDLILSNNENIWLYDSANRYFYVEATTTGLVYDYTHNTNFTSGNTYRITRVIDNDINTLNFANNQTINNQLLTIEEEPSSNSGFIISANGSGYTIRNTYNNYYLSAVDGGDHSAVLSQSANTTNSIWNYDSTNQSLYQSVSINYPTISYEHSQTFAAGQYYLTTGDVLADINALGASGTTITNYVLTTDATPDANSLLTISRNGNNWRIQVNGYYLRNNNGNLQLSTTATNWTYNNSRLSNNVRGTTYYLRFNNGTWSLGAGTANATNIYLTSTTTVDNYQDVTHYLSFDSEWTLKQTQDDTTKLTFTNYTEREVSETNDYYVYYDNGFTLEKDAQSSLNFATYTKNRTINSTSRGAISTNSYYSANTNIAATITSLYNGVDYRNNATIDLTSANNGRALITARNDLQLEYLTIDANGYSAINNNNASTSYINTYAALMGNYKNVRVGRGMTPMSWEDDSSTIFAFVFGGSNATSLGNSNNDNNAFRFTIESGRYSGLMAIRSRNDNSNSEYNFYGSMEFVLGNDYDRVTENNNNMDVFYRTASSNNYGINGKLDADIPGCLMRVKSGKFGVYFFEENPDDTSKAYAGIYVGGLTVTANSDSTDISSRVLIVEGGNVANVIGGLRLASSESDTVKTKVYVKGGVVGNIVGGAGVSTTYGDRYISVTGGEIEYSVSGGSNGYLATSTTGQDNGQLAGNSYVHIGGNAKVGTKGSGELYYVAYGSVLGAGNGNDNIDNSGRVNYTNLFVSEEAVIEGSLYGGGNYGNVVNNVNIQIDGGTIKGSVYGGPNQNGVGTVTINSNSTTEVTYTDVNTFTSGLKYIINNNANGNRNALSATNVAVGNTTLSTTTSPGPTVNWLITDVGNGYTLRNENGRYLTSKPGVGSASLAVSTTADNAVWQYDETLKTFHKTEGVITSSQVTYTSNTEFNSDTEYIITNTNTGTMNALTGGTTISTTTLSTTSLPNVATGWVISPSGSGYTIQNVSNGYYLGYTSSGGWNPTYSLTMNDEATVWTYNTTNRYFYFVIEGWLGDTNYYLRYNNGWSLNTNANNATSLYFTTYTAVNQTVNYEYYLNYNNGWSLTTTTSSVNALIFTQYSDSTRISATASNKSYGNVTINMTNGEIINTLYGGSCIKGNIAGLVDINITGGKIGKNLEHQGSVFGGGYGEDTFVASGINLDIVDTANDTIIDGNVYGGSALGTVIGNINVNVVDNNTTKVITLNNDLYCGSMGNEFSSVNGNITGNCTITVKGGTYPNSVYGGNNANGSAYGEILVTIGGDNVKTTVNNVYGGGNQADSLATSNKVYILSDSDVTNAFGGGNEALVDTTYLYLNGGHVDNAYGGSNVASLTTSNVNLNGADVTNIFGGSNRSGDVVTANITTTSGTATNIYGGNNLGGYVENSSVTINGGTIESAYGGGNLAEVNLTNVLVSNGTVTNVFGGGNEALVEESTVNLTGGTITNTYGGGNKAGINVETNVTLDGATATNIFGGSNQSGDVPVSNITITSGSSTNVYGGNNLGGKTTTTKIAVDGGTVGSVFGGGNLAEVTTTNIEMNGGTVTDMFGGGNEAIANQTNVDLNGGKVTNAYGGGNKAGITTDTNINLKGATLTNIFGGSNQSGDVPISNITTTSGTATNIYGGNNLGGKTTTTKINANGGTIQSVYGGGNLAEVTTTNVELNGATITNVFGGGNEAIVNQTNVNLKSGNVANTYGGGNKAGITTDTNVTLEGATATNIFGGSNQSGSVPISNINVISGTTSKLYGGNNAGGTTIKTNVNMTGGNSGDIFGGGNEALTGDSVVAITGGTITGSVYGGGNKAGINNNASVKIANATINGNVFGGGNFGIVSKDTNVDIRNATVLQSAYAGGNGQSAIVHGNTNINVHGTSNIGKHVFGGGNAANTGTESTNKSTGTVNIAGGTIGGNVYGGANTATLYGETTVNVGYNAVTPGTPVGMTFDDTTSAYENNEGRITMNSTFMGTTGGYWSNFLSVENSRSDTISDYTLVVYTGSNEISACYNCFYETVDGVTTFTPRTDWGFSLASNSSYELQGSWNITDASEIYVIGYYSNNVTDPIFTVGYDYERADIDIGGTVFGGGEANASGSEEYDYSFISVTTGITINIDGKDHDNFDIHQSIFGSGNASSTTGYSYIYIDNYGTDDDIKRNVSIQRANLVSISNSHIDLSGATDRTNEFSDVLFSLSRIDELKLKNNSSLYLQTGANLLLKFKSLVDIDGEEKLAAVSIDKESKNVTKNVDNRLYVLEDKVLNIATNETITAYGEVDGMTFFGMYRHDRDGNIVRAMYDPSYGYGSSPTTGDLYYFSSGTYVLGMHEIDHNIEVDGFYSNYEDEENPGQLIVDYIVPTPEEASYYMWTIGVQVISYDITLTASKYATLGTQELQFINYSEPNTKFSVVGFSYDELDPNVSLVDPNTIPKIATNESEADTRLGLSIRTGTSGWITIGETNFLTDSDKLWDGTTDYAKENSASAASLIFYLYHSKNIQTEGNLGTVTISMLVVVPVDELTNKIERININVTLTRALYTTDNYEGAMIPGREYQLFSSSRTDITTSSSLSAYYSLFIDSDKEIYKDGYHHTLVSSFVLPLNTKITMIDLTNSENPQYYYHVISQEDVSEATTEFSVNGEASYDLSKFIRMGSLSEDDRYDDATMNDIYYDETLGIAIEEFIFIVDFKESGITENKLGNTLMMEMRDSEDETLYTVLGIQHANLTYNLYHNKDAVVEVEGTLSNDTVYLGDTTQLTVTTNFLQQTDASKNAIYDTTFHDNKLGIKITLIDQNGNQVNGVDMMGISFTLDDVTYYPRSDGEIRINLAERVANVESRITINTINSNLTKGTYKINIESFYSADGIYYGLTSSDTASVDLNVLEKLYGLNAEIDDSMVIIDKDTGYTANEDSSVKISVKYSGGLESPNIRLAMYRRSYDSAYDTNYNLIDINDYLIYSLKDSQEENIYNIFPTPIANQTIILNFKPKLTTGTYKLEFRLYDGDVYIGEVSKYVIIR